MGAKPANPTAAGLLPFREARKLVEAEAARVRPSGAEAVALLRSQGRVLAEEVAADRDLPPFPRATRDGYAVRAADLERLPAELKVIGEIRAGGALDPGLGPLVPGCAAEIMTGAPVPAGADAVVMVEYTSRRGEQVVIERAAAAGENVVPRGSEARSGEVLLARGTRMTAAAIAAAASAGQAEVRVHLRPRVAILPTGDELVEIAAQRVEHRADEELERNHSRNGISRQSEKRCCLRSGAARRAPEDHRAARLDERAGEQKLRPQLAQHLLHQVVLAGRDAAAHQQQVSSQALLEQPAQRLALVRRDGQLRRFAACGFHLRRERVAVGVADLLYLRRRGDVDDLVAGGENGNPGPAMDRDLLLADRCGHADLRRS